MRERCKRMSEWRSEWSCTRCGDFIVDLPTVRWMRRNENMSRWRRPLVLDAGADAMVSPPSYINPASATSSCLLLLPPPLSMPPSPLQYRLCFTHPPSSPCICDLCRLRPFILATPTDLYKSLCRAAFTISLQLPASIFSYSFTTF